MAKQLCAGSANGDANHVVYSQMTQSVILDTQLVCVIKLNILLLKYGEALALALGWGNKHPPPKTFYNDFKTCMGRKMHGIRSMPR